MKNYWLMKSEPSCFSIDDLKTSPNSTFYWHGVRNYQARNFIKTMKKGEEMFFYHSNCAPPGIVGIATIVSDPYPDHTAFDPDSEHPDPKSDPNNPRWFMVDVCFKQKFHHILSLDVLKNQPALADLAVVKRGNRLSVLPVNHEQWKYILELANQ